MDDRERQIRQKLKDDLKHYAQKCLKIRTKSGSIEPLCFNKAQLYIHEQLERQRYATGKVRALILKGRQQGASTLISARFFHKVTHTRGMQAFILTHALDATQNLYKMATRYYEYLPSVVKPQVTTGNAKELVFGLLDSGYKLGTAENKATGRSATVQLLHGSEVAFWANAAEHAQGIMQAVPNSTGTEIILESTANGVGNYFHQMWQKAEQPDSEFCAIFVPWYWQDEYKIDVNDNFVLTNDEIDLSLSYGLTKEQIAWRRIKIAELSINGTDGEKSFKQEYPCNATEAFQLTGEDSYIASEIVVAARKCAAEKYGPLIVGVDPARFGDDRTSIIRRQGRQAFGLESYVKKDTMEVAGLVHKIITEESPVKVCVDVGGLGAGVVDRLKELGHGNIIVAVNSGSTPLDAQRFYNKRAEMWAMCLQWLREMPCQIPDSDSLHADLCNIRYTYDSNSRLRLEKKEDMKKRGIRSPDEAEALCLTFALPPSALEIDKGTRPGQQVMTQLGQQMRRQSYLRNKRDAVR